MATGSVKWYDAEKGFGFIAQDNGDSDLFVHHSVVGTELLADGDKVEFTVGMGPKGARAESLRVLERSGNSPRAPRSLYGGAGNSGTYGNGGGNRSNSFDRQTERRTPVDPSLLPRGTGVIRNFDRAKGFGFITQDQGGDDMFFHESVVTGGSVRPGDRVEFRISESAKGPRAEQVIPNEI